MGNYLVLAMQLHVYEVVRHCSTTKQAVERTQWQLDVDGEQGVDFFGVRAALATRTVGLARWCAASPCSALRCCTLGESPTHDGACYVLGVAAGGHARSSRVLAALNRHFTTFDGAVNAQSAQCIILQVCSDLDDLVVVIAWATHELSY